MYNISDARSFLSGNITEKLVAAEEGKAIDPSFEKEVQALHGAMPSWIDITEIAQFGISIGVTWIPTAYYEEFIWQQFGIRVRLFYSPSVGSWEMEVLSTLDTSANYEYGMSYSEVTPKGNEIDKWFLPIADSIDKGLFTMCFHFKTPRHSDKQIQKEAISKQDTIKRLWTEWCSQGEVGEQLEKLYNQVLNTKVLRNWDGAGEILRSHLPHLGMYQKWQEWLRPYQLDAAWRACVDTQGKNGILIGLEVGLGKTSVIALAVMLRIHYKTVNKAMVVVQKSTLLQFGATFREMFPKARILCATAEDCQEENRQRFLARAAYWQWDVVILTHENFKSIPVKAETERLYINRRLEAVEMELAHLESQGQTYDWKKKKGNRNIKKLSELRNKLTVELRDLEAKRDVGICWENISPQLLVIDEAQVYKNDEIPTKLQVAGIATNDSQRAIDFHLKLCHLETKYKQGFLLLSTGTPEPTNSICGIFVMQRYLQPQVLRQNRMSHFDAWISNFGRITVDPEATIDGDIRLKERLKEFVNLPELLQQWLDVCHVKRFEDVKGQGNFNRPEMKLKKVVNYMTKYQMDTMADIQNRFADIRSGDAKKTKWTDKQGYLMFTPNPGKKRIRVTHPITGMPLKKDDMEIVDKYNLEVDTKLDSYILCYSDARNLMMAPQLVDPEIDIEKYDKIMRCARRLLRWWRLTKEERAVQLVFCDMGTPGGSANFYIYEFIREWLVARGVPKSEIAFIHDYKKDEEKEELFRKVNAGEIRILIGSTSPMGIGVNVQERVKVMHLLDIPKRPDEFEQRIGRGIRSGNRYPKVLVYQYLVQGEPGVNYGADAAQFTMLQNKIQMRQAVLRGDPSVRRIVEEDDQQSIYMMLVAHATGSSEVMDFMRLGVELEKLCTTNKILSQDINKLQSTKEGSIKNAKKFLIALEHELAQIMPDIDIVTRLQEEGFGEKYFRIEIDGEEFLGTNNKEDKTALSIPKAKELAQEKLNQVMHRIESNAKHQKGNRIKQAIGRIGKFHIFAQPFADNKAYCEICWISAGAASTSDRLTYKWNFGKTVGIKNIEKALFGIPNGAKTVKAKIAETQKLIADRQDALGKKQAQKKEILCQINELSDKRRDIQQRLDIKDL